MIGVNCSTNIDLTAKGTCVVTEEGIIERISHRKAVVRIQRSSACAHCEAREACQLTAVKAMLIEAKEYEGEGFSSVPGESLMFLR